MSEETVQKVYTDEDILNHVVMLLEAAVTKSRTTNFQPVAFRFSDLELLLKVCKIALERTQTFNSLVQKLVSRDSAIVGSIDSLKTFFCNLITSFSNINSSIERATVTAETLHGLAEIFIPKEQSKEPEGEDSNSNN